VSKEHTVKAIHPNRFRNHLVVLSFVMAGTIVSADRVRLRSGQVIDGTLTGADASTVRLMLANGTRADVAVADIAGIEFAARAPKHAPQAPAPAPGRAPAPVTVPANTMLNVRLTETIDVDVTKAGATFRALVDDPIMLDGKVVVPRGAAVAVQAANVAQSGKMKGSDKISLKANSITFGGRTYEIVTAYVEAKGSGEGKKTARKVGGGAGLGAVVGGIAGGGSGAAIGAAVGGATGAVVASQGQEHLKLPAETRLQFQLTAAVTIKP
jgi:hypothetical protein